MNPILVTCPACRETMEVDPRTGKVLKHSPQPKVVPGKDFLKERMKSLEEEKTRREAAVAESREREGKRHERLDELFRKVKEVARDEPSPDRPLRDFDLD